MQYLWLSPQPQEPGPPAGMPHRPWYRRTRWYIIGGIIFAFAVWFVAMSRTTYLHQQVTQKIHADLRPALLYALDSAPKNSYLQTTLNGGPPLLIPQFMLDMGGVPGSNTNLFNFESAFANFWSTTGSGPLSRITSFYVWQSVTTLSVTVDVQYAGLLGRPTSDQVLVSLNIPARWIKPMPQ